MRFLEVVSRGVETWLDMLPEAALPAALAGLLGAFLRVLVDALLDSMCRAGLHLSSLIVLVYPPAIVHR